MNENTTTPTHYEAVVCVPSPGANDAVCGPNKTIAVQLVPTSSYSQSISAITPDHWQLALSVIFISYLTYLTGQGFAGVLKLIKQFADK